MAKRDFRATKTPRPNRADYPELDTFDASRRSFLGRLGASVLGAGALGSLLSGCAERAVGGKGKPDAEPWVTGGVPRQLDAGLDTRPLEPDAQEPLLGDAPQPDARIDSTPPPMGEAPLPDARVDPPPPKQDGMIAGGAPAPDARADKPERDMMLGGVAPAPDARTKKP